MRPFAGTCNKLSPRAGKFGVQVQNLKKRLVVPPRTRASQPLSGIHDFPPSAQPGASGQPGLPADQALATEACVDEPIVVAASDTALMRHVATGSTPAFAILVERHSHALYRVAWRLLGDGHEAEDAVQDCFARLWQHAPRWQPSGAGLAGWLHRVVVNLCFDRRRRRRLVLAENLPERIDDAPLADRLLEADEASNAVARALGQLPERYRAALVLCYYEGLTNAVAAEALELNIKAMESLLFRARQKMRSLLEQGQFSPRETLALYAERAA